MRWRSAVERVRALYAAFVAFNGRTDVTLVRAAILVAIIVWAIVKLVSANP